MTKFGREADSRQYELPLPLKKEGTLAIRAGRLGRKNAVREALTMALSNSAMSREEIAAELSRLTGEAVSVNHINNWCSEAKREWRFPLEMATALCMITGDFGIMEAVLEGTGHWLANERTMAAAEYGQLVAEEKKRAAKKRKLLEVLG